MKKQFIIPIVLIVLGWGIFTFVEKRKIRTKDNTIQLSWSNLRKDQLTGLATTLYKPQGTLTYTIQRVQGEWVLTEPLNTPLLAEKTILLANSFLTLSPEQEFTNVDPENYTSYGLDTPKVRVIGTLKDGSSVGFIIGDKTTVGDQYYIAEIDKPNSIYSVSTEDILFFIEGIEAIIETRIFSQSSENALAIEFHNLKNEVIKLTNIDQFWSQTFPEANKNVDWGTRKFLLSARDLVFEANSLKFNVTPMELLDVGIDLEQSPRLIVTFLEGEKVAMYLSSKATENYYPVYLAKENMIVFCSKASIHSVFDIQTADFQTARKN